MKNKNKRGRGGTSPRQFWYKDRVFNNPVYFFKNNT